MTQVMYRDVNPEVMNVIDSTQKKRNIFRLTSSQRDNLRYWATELNSGRWAQADGNLISTGSDGDEFELPINELNDNKCPDNSYCCLGVACVLRDRKTQPIRAKRRSLKLAIKANGTATNVIPRTVRSTFGIKALDDADTTISAISDLVDLLDRDDTAELKRMSRELMSTNTFSTMNDNGWLFGDIAYYIREFILPNSYIVNN